MRRMHCEQEQLAIRIVNTLGQWMGGGESKQASTSTGQVHHRGARAPGNSTKISSDEMLANLGAHFM